MQIDKIIQSLALKKSYFSSEKDFQKWLCYEIRNQGYIIEKSSSYIGQKVDILVKDSNHIVLYAIQLRHKTATLSLDDGTIKLKNHGAQDQARYDFIKDIKSLENISKASENVKGYAVLLSNDHRYWEYPIKLNSVDEHFLIYEGKVLIGNLEWSSKASNGTRINREDSIALSKKYKCVWKTYSSVSAKKNNLFKFLVLEV